MACGIPTAAPGSPNRHVPSPLGLPWTDRVEEAVRRIARQTGESAFFSVKRGNETVCLLREDGNFPIRSHVLYEGVRFPLGAASAGLAILAHLSERERETYLAERTLTHAYGAEHAPGPLRERIAETRRSGFALNPGQIVEGIWGMASAVFDGSGDPRWALSINGIEARFPEARRAAIRQRPLGAVGPGLLLAPSRTPAPDHCLGGRPRPRRRGPLATPARRLTA